MQGRGVYIGQVLGLGVFGWAFGASDRGLTREIRLGLAVGSGLCGRPQTEKREERRPGDCFWRPKTSDVRPAILPL